MTADIFLDTNILVYVIDDSDRVKQRRATAVVRDGLASGRACISWQVLQEFLNVATQKFKKPLSTDLARQYVDEFLEPLCTVWPSPQIYVRALEIQRRHQLHFYDSLIVAGALDAGCKRLITEDLQDGLKIADLTVENPFKAR